MAAYEYAPTRCCICDGEIYEGEYYYHINGEAVCEDCIGVYARQVFAPCRVMGGE